MRLKIYKMAMSIFPKFLTLKWNISRTIWLIAVGDGWFFFCIFHALSFELNSFFDRRFPLTLSYLGGADSAPLMFFFHHPETAQAMKLKLPDFKDTYVRHILQVIPGCCILRCYHGNKITKGTLQNLTQ